MVLLLNKQFPNLKASHGLTLIEVLIALAIVGIAMMAVVKAVTQNIRATHHLQQKTIALWVGQSVLNEAIAGVFETDHSTGNQSETTMLGQNWYWQLSSEATRNPRIIKLNVKVFANVTDQELESPIVTLESFRYQQDQTNVES